MQESSKCVVDSLPQLRGFKMLHSVDTSLAFVLPHCRRSMMEGGVSAAAAQDVAVVVPARSDSAETFGVGEFAVVASSTGAALGPPFQLGDAVPASNQPKVAVLAKSGSDGLSREDSFGSCRIQHCRYCKLSQQD